MVLIKKVGDKIFNYYYILNLSSVGKRERERERDNTQASIATESM